MNISQKITIYCQYLLPQHLLSRVIGSLANSRCKWFKNRLIRWFIKRYDVDMNIAKKSNPSDYETFNAFFTRRLKLNARPIEKETDSVIYPVDGALGQFGLINQDLLLQAKGKNYSLQALFGGDPYHRQFTDGQYATFYLAPHNYHHVHMPLRGQLLKSIYVPGSLFSVNPLIIDHIDNIFARNERLISVFRTQHGLMTVIMVGAMLVSGIRVAWQDNVKSKKNSIQTWNYHDGVIINRGEELGYFEFGSTVIVLFESNMIAFFDHLQTSMKVQMGEKFARFF